MYAALGDQKEQDQLRVLNADTHHCKFLVENPDACDRFPKDIGTAKAGQPCPNNPHFKEDLQDVYRAVDDHVLLINQALDLHRIRVLGLLPPIDCLTPSQITALSVVEATLNKAQKRRQQEASRQHKERSGS